MNPLAIFKLIVTLLPVIHSAITTAEFLFHGKNKDKDGNPVDVGPSKLSHAISLVEAMLPKDNVEAAQSVSDLLPVVISAAVGILNNGGGVPKVNPAPLTQAQQQSAQST